MGWLGEHLKKITKLNVDGRLTVKKKLICAAISLLVLNILPFTVFYMSEKFLDEMGKTVKVAAFTGQIDHDENGFFIPLKILNTGDKDLILKRIEVSTCYGTTPLSYFPDYPLTMNGGSYDQKIRGKQLISSALKKSCYEEINVTSQACSFYPFKINNTMMMVPLTNCSAYVCGTCEISIEVETDLKNETIKTSIYSAKEVPLVVYSNNYNPHINVNESANLGEMVFQFFMPREQCEYEHTCATQEYKEDSLYVNKSLELIVVPNRTAKYLEELEDLTVVVRPRQP